MRLVITGGSLLVVIMLMLLIQTSIVSTNLRDNEVSSSLDTAVDYAMDRVSEIYSAGDYDVNQREKYLNGLMADFCTTLNKMIGTDGTVTASLMNADLEKGLIDISVCEEYTYPLKSRKGVCCCEKAFKFK